jgi:hypothetical protein
MPDEPFFNALLHQNHDLTLMSAISPSVIMAWPVAALKKYCLNYRLGRLS